MPKLRSQLENTVVMKKVVDQTQWVMVAPEKLLQEGEEDCALCKMPHPQGSIESLFLFKNGESYQLMKCEESYRSWFIDETVQKDGSMFMVTPIDPLFLALPYLEKFALQDQYTTLDNIFVDEKYPRAMVKLEECLTKKNLLNVCNCKGSDDFVAYKSDESKILAWLSLKIQKLAFHLSKTNINVCQGAKLTNFVRISDEKKSEDDCLRYAWTIVSDYVTVKWSEKLKENLNIKDIFKEDVKQVVKKQKLNDNTSSDKIPSEKTCGQVEDYRDHSKTKQADKRTTKLTSSQKLLLKVDKKGMKKMSSFFTSKTKK